MQGTGMQGSSPSAGAGRYEGGREEQASGRTSHVSDTVREALDRLSHAASTAASRLSARSEALLQQPAVETARTYVRQHPLVAIGIALAIGILLSKLTSRR